jgi:hypothetical protein
MVIRYGFLWSHEARAGATQARKDRPCAIVVAVPRGPAGDIRVAVVPVTHVKSGAPGTSIRLPMDVAAQLGLDDQPCRVRLDELNLFSWPGYDLRRVPGTDRISYGALPKTLFEQIRAGVLRLNTARKTRQLTRD